MTIKTECSSMSPISSEPPRLLCIETKYRYLISTSKSTKTIDDILVILERKIAACKYWCPCFISVLKINIFNLRDDYTLTVTREMKYNMTNIWKILEERENEKIYLRKCWQDRTLAWLLVQTRHKYCNNISFFTHIQNPFSDKKYMWKIIWYNKSE